MCNFASEVSSHSLTTASAAPIDRSLHLIITFGRAPEHSLERILEQARSSVRFGRDSSLSWPFSFTKILCLAKIEFRFAIAAGRKHDVVKSQIPEHLFDKCSRYWEQIIQIREPVLSDQMRREGRHAAVQVYLRFEYGYKVLLEELRKQQAVREKRLEIKRNPAKKDQNLQSSEPASLQFRAGAVLHVGWSIDALPDPDAQVDTVALYGNSLPYILEIR